MKILWLSHRDFQSPRAGGAERSIQEITTRLAARGHEVHLVTGGSANSSREEEVRSVHIHRAPTPLGPHMRATSFYGNSCRPDVVINDLAHVVPWLTPLFSKVPGTAFFHHFHGRTLRGQVSPPIALALGWLETQYRYIYRNWTFVTETIGSVRDLEALGIPQSRCVRIAPGLDTKRFSRGSPASSPVIVYFGGMRRYKRPLDVLRACELLKSRGLEFKLYMLGEGPVTIEARRLSSLLGLDRMVVFTGRLTDDELVSLVRQSHVNVHCSVTEGWCLSALEAAACGVPTVAYRVPGLIESVVDGQSGLLVEDGDFMQLARGIETVLRNPMPWRERSRAYAERFSWDSCASKWEEHLKAISQKDEFT